MKRIITLALFVAAFVLSGCNVEATTFEDGSSRIVFDNITIVIHSER